MNVQLCIAFWVVFALTLKVYEIKGNRRQPKRKRREANSYASDGDKHYWEAIGEAELQRALHNALNNNVAKNVILFLGDGMGISTVTASRIYDGQNKGGRGEENFLVFDKFPHVGLAKTYSVNYQVSDSAGTGTAYLTGVKTNNGVIGFDARVKRGKCDTITNDSFVHSIAKWSQDKGKRTGVVTSTRITHATPASIYAHVPNRNWECDTFVPSNCPNVKDIARQLVEDEPGMNLNVIMGGGLQDLDGSVTNRPHDKLKVWECVRSDNRKLWKEWLEQKQSQGKSAAFVTHKTTLNEVNLNSTEYLMGIFANDHLPYEYEKREYNLDIPTLSEMTEAAITVLNQGTKGFFLLVEGGRIDHSHHDGQARAALEETVAMNEAVAKALELTDDKDTLIVVTADHSHTMTINGYPERGNPITGLTQDLASDLMRKTTLAYTNGPGYNYQVHDGKVVRQNPALYITSAWDYKQQAGIPIGKETHGGEDVTIYASGPMAHLFHSVHEQNYIPYAMAYASCVDVEERHCKEKQNEWKIKLP